MSMFNNILFNAGLFNGDAIVGVSSSDDIVFNNYGLQNKYITTRYIRHKSGHDTEFIQSNIARSHGVRMQAIYRRGKVVSLVGNVKADDHDDLIDRVDEMKKYLRTLNGILKVTRGTKVRKYYATWLNPQDFMEDEDAFHNTFIPFNLQLFISYFGFSEDRKVYTDEITAATFQRELYHDGSADEGRLVTIFNINSETDLTKIEWENTTNGEAMAIEPVGGFSAGDYVKIDGENQNVSINGVEVKHSGLIPSLVPDANSYEAAYTSTAHSITATNKFYNYYS